MNKKRKKKKNYNQNIRSFSRPNAPWFPLKPTSSQLDCWNGIGCSLCPSAAERVEIHLHLLSAAQHADGGVESSGRHHHLPPPDDLPVAGEEHLEGDNESDFGGHVRETEAHTPAASHSTQSLVINAMYFSGIRSAHYLAPIAVGVVCFFFHCYLRNVWGQRKYRIYIGALHTNRPRVLN